MNKRTAKRELFLTFRLHYDKKPKLTGNLTAVVRNTIKYLNLKTKQNETTKSGMHTGAR